jgi:hypothetical protein
MPQELAPFIAASMALSLSHALRFTSRRSCTVTSLGEFAVTLVGGRPHVGCFSRRHSDEHVLSDFRIGR